MSKAPDPLAEQFSHAVDARLASACGRSSREPISGRSWPVSEPTGLGWDGLRHPRSRYLPPLACALVQDGDGLPGHLGNPARGGLCPGGASIRATAASRV